MSITFRVSKKELEAIVGNLNRQTKHNYSIWESGAGTRIVRLINDVDTKNGIETVTPYGTKREVYKMVASMITILRMEK